MAMLKSGEGYRARSIFTALFMTGVIAFTFGYAYFQASAFLSGPEIEFISPSTEDVVTEPSITVRGTAERIAFLELNGRPIFINEKGVFEEDLILSPGINIIELKAEDRFGRVIVRYLNIFFKN